MLLGLDHIVVAVPNLEAAIKSYEDLGFTVVPGGRHPVGTYNGLISLPDGSYIELISFYRDNPQHRWWPALQKGGGLVDFCMQTDDLVGDTAKLRGAGVNIDDPVPWTRTRPDGYELKWMLSLPREGHRGVAPFLIQDETPRDERIPRETKHKNGVLGVGTVTVAVDDLQTVRHWYRSILGHEGMAVERRDIEAAGFFYRIGPHRMEFVEPAAKTSPVANWLERRGPSPFAATLLTEFQNSSPLDTKLTHSAALSFQRI